MPLELPKEADSRCGWSIPQQRLCLRLLARVLLSVHTILGLHQGHEVVGVNVDECVEMKQHGRRPGRCAGHPRPARPALCALLEQVPARNMWHAASAGRALRQSAAAAHC